MIINKHTSSVLSLFLIEILFLLLSPTKILAQLDCTEEAITQYITGCDPDNNCSAITEPRTYPCLQKSGICEGYVETNYCSYVNGKCTLSDTSWVTIPCSAGGGGSTCSDPDWSAPQFTSIDWSSGTGGKMKAFIQFTDGGANTVNIAASSNKLSVATYCDPKYGSTAANGCVIYTGLGGNGTNVTSPLVIDGFTKGTVYYFGIYGIGPTGCYGQGVGKTTISSCEITPDNFSFNIGGPSQTATSEVVSTYVWGTVPTEVKTTFSSSKTGVATVNPASETNSYRYQTSVSPVGAGSAELRSNVYLDNVLSCTAFPSAVTVINPTPSCTLSLTPATKTVTEGASAETFTATVIPVNGSIESVRFTSSNLNAATVTSPDTISPTYTTTATIATNVNSDQTTTIRAYAKVGGVVDLCNDSSTLTVLNSLPVNDIPWWQVVDGDVTAAQNLVSDVPTSNVFIDDGDGGYPGVPVYGTSLDVGDGSTSSTNWNADTTIVQPRTFDYSYFEGLIPDDVTLNDISKLLAGGATQSYGYEWYKVTGNVSIDSLLNLNTRKVILFVSGDLNINNEIFVANGIGFFGAFVGGSINVDGGITRVGNPSIEGIYLTDKDFSTVVGTSKLWVRGSIVALGGFNLQRNLANDATPSEIFEFAPDQVLLFPQALMFKRTKWAEVAP